MVKISKNMTHIYHDRIRMNQIVIGSPRSVNAVHIELFEKSLVLTSDLKRLPLLLGGKLFIPTTSHLFQNLSASNLGGVRFTGILMNGTYEDDDFTEPMEVLEDDQAKDDILLWVNSYYSTSANSYFGIRQDSHWDFEGAKILYDTMTLLVFAEGNVNVSTSNFGSVNCDLISELEIDWEPVSAKEMQEFIMEHIYAKQGD